MKKMIKTNDLITYKGKTEDGKELEGQLLLVNTEYMILPIPINFNIYNKKEFFIIPKSLKRWSGVRDKTKRKIYEGDYVVNEDGMGDVWKCEYSKGLRCFVFRLKLVDMADELIPVYEPIGVRIIPKNKIIKNKKGRIII